MHFRENNGLTRNVSSFKQALKAGHNPQQYSYDPTLIPSDVFDARLDFKIWSKRILAINCYFTRITTGEQFVLSVYCNKQTGQYSIGSTLNFSSCPTDTIYRLNVDRKPTGKIALLNAFLV